MSQKPKFIAERWDLPKNHIIYDPPSATSKKSAFQVTWIFTVTSHSGEKNFLTQKETGKTNGAIWGRMKAKIYTLTSSASRKWKKEYYEKPEGINLLSPYVLICSQVQHEDSSIDVCYTLFLRKTIIIIIEQKESQKALAKIDVRFSSSSTSTEYIRKSFKLTLLPSWVQNICKGKKFQK